MTGDCPEEIIRNLERRKKQETGRNTFGVKADGNKNKGGVMNRFPAR